MKRGPCTAVKTGAVHAQLVAQHADTVRRFCAPATLVPAAVTPAVLLGPTMTVTLTTGSCSVAKDANATGALLATCQPPTITWVKVRGTDAGPRPARVTSCHGPATPSERQDCGCRREAVCMLSRRLRCDLSCLHVANRALRAPCFAGAARADAASFMCQKSPVARTRPCAS